MVSDDAESMVKAWLPGLKTDQQWVSTPIQMGTVTQMTKAASLLRGWSLTCRQNQPRQPCHLLFSEGLRGDKEPQASRYTTKRLQQKEERTRHEFTEFSECKISSLRFTFALKLSNCLPYCKTSALTMGDLFDPVSLSPSRRPVTVAQPSPAQALWESPP
jgi:hypothetical protein